MVELRKYQQDLLTQVQDALADEIEARVMMQLPTGGGKTQIAAALLQWWLGNESKAVWLTHRTELSDQTCGVLNRSGVRAVNNLPWDISAPAPYRNGGVVILMAQTVSRRNRFDGVWRQYDPMDLLVIDEAHHATAIGWRRAINQWPGAVVGLTATPWRLSQNEGFNHLFNDLILGPQIKELQAAGFLAQAKVLMPEREDLILGGDITAGDYSDSGIKQANQGRPEVWTASALRFWQNYAQDRQTIVYAVSKDHAENLAAVFLAANIPAAVLLGDTPLAERAQRIKQFSAGALKVLVNVAVATEGFDLPDAACVVLTRPTLSLALYLQMVGRGLRPKSDGGDCRILDLAGNVERHGFPEEEREWSLYPRGRTDELGRPPVVRCPECAAVSPAASHYCQECGEPFGKDCGRCGKWRAWQTWSAETDCGDTHELVCNRCHLDAHELGDLPEKLKEAVREELTEAQMEVNPAHLQTLEEFRDALSAVAEALVYANKADDFAAFNRLTRQMRSVLRQERRIREVAQEAAENTLMEMFSPLLLNIFNTLTEMGYTGKSKAVATINLQEPRLDIRVFDEGDDEGENLWSTLTIQQIDAVSEAIQRWTAERVAENQG